MEPIGRDTNVYYFTPKDLARRWGCARSSVDRITRRAGFSRVCLGEGRNGMVRFRRDEVERYETERTIPGD